MTANDPALPPLDDNAQAILAALRGCDLVLEGYQGMARRLIAAGFRRTSPAVSSDAGGVSAFDLASERFISDRMLDSIKALEAENGRLRAALEKIASTDWGTDATAYTYHYIAKGALAATTPTAGGADDEEPIGPRCESCGRIITGMDYNADDDGVTWHKHNDPECQPAKDTAASAERSGGAALDTDFVNDLRERSKDDSEIITGSEIRQLCEMIDRLRARQGREGAGA